MSNLKDVLIQEAQHINATVELDSIFENVNLAPDVRAQFEAVFQTVVTKHATELAESHINSIADLAEAKLEEMLESSTSDIESRLVETAERFMTHLAEQWLAENKLAVDRGIKADLFESVMGGFKQVFIEHNVTIPEESVDVVAEMEEALEEASVLSDTLLREKEEARTELAQLKRTQAINESTSELTLTQKEKVIGLVEGVEYSDKFTSKLNAIVDMVKTSKINESTSNVTLNENVNNDVPNLNFTENAAPQPAVTPQNARMNSYVTAAKRIH